MVHALHPRRSLAARQSNPSVRRRIEPSESADDLEELLDGLKLVESLDHTVEIERDVFVDDDVAEARKPLEFPNQLRRETLIPRQVSNGFRVVLVAVPSPGGDLSGDTKDVLGHL